MREGKVIVVDDNEAVLKTLRLILSREFRTVVCVQVPTLLPALLREEDVDVVLLDMNFVNGKQTGDEGLFWLDRIRQSERAPAVILITAFADVDLAVSSLKRGATDFVVKPWDNEKLVSTIVSAWENVRAGRNKEKDIYIRSEEELPVEDKGPSGKDSIVKMWIGSLLKKYAVAYGKPLPRISEEAIRKLSELAWKGNLEALQQCVERTVLLCDAILLDVGDFYWNENSIDKNPLTLEEMEKQFIADVLTETNGNLTVAARRLDISRQTLYNKMKKYNL